MWLIVLSRGTCVKRDVTSIVIYRAECTCGETCIEETKRNFAVRQAENENKSHNFEPARHLAKHPTHAYTWNIACSEKTTLRRKHNGGPANCLREANPKQTSTFFCCETVPLRNNLIEQNQVVCKFPPCTPLTMIVRSETFWLRKHH